MCSERIWEEGGSAGSSLCASRHHAFVGKMLVNLCTPVVTRSSGTCSGFCAHPCQAPLELPRTHRGKKSCSPEEAGAHTWAPGASDRPERAAKLPSGCKPTQPPNATCRDGVIDQSVPVDAASHRLQRSGKCHINCARSLRPDSPYLRPSRSNMVPERAESPNEPIRQHPVLLGSDRNALAIFWRRV